MKVTFSRLQMLPIVAGFICLLSQSSRGQIVLSGLLQNGTAPNGQTAGSPIWNTLGNEASFANLYVTQPNLGYTAPFLNHGNGSGASISYTLTPGAYEFYFFSDAFADNNPGFYGLNLFFDGDVTHPGIAAFSPAGTSSANAVPSGLDILPLSGVWDNRVSAPGTLSYTANDLTVTVTGYGWGVSGAFAIPAVDRVRNLDDSPEGAFDGVGRLNLTVAAVAVPEPSIVALVSLAVVLLLLAKSRVSPKHPASERDSFGDATTR